MDLAEIQLIQDVIVILVTTKNEENLIKIEDAGVATTLKIYFQTFKGSLLCSPGRIWLKFEVIQDVIVIFVTFKNEKDPIKIEGARVGTIQNIDFSNTQGQITPQSEVGCGRNSNSSEMLLMSF